MTPKQALEFAVKKCGGAAELARNLGISVQAVSQWERVPAERLGQVSLATNISAADLRPDLIIEVAPEQSTQPDEAKT